MGFWWAGNGKRCYCYRSLSIFKLILLKTYRLVFFNQCLAWSFNSLEWLLDWTKADFLSIFWSLVWWKMRKSAIFEVFFQNPIIMYNSANTRKKSLPIISPPAFSSCSNFFYLVKVSCFAYNQSFLRTLNGKTTVRLRILICFNIIFIILAQKVMSYHNLTRYNRKFRPSKIVWKMTTVGQKN